MTVNIARSLHNKLNLHAPSFSCNMSYRLFIPGCSESIDKSRGRCIYKIVKS